MPRFLVDFMDGAGWLLGILTALAVAWLIAQTVRRVLGVRVGWPRSFVVSILLVWSLTSLIPWVAQIAGLKMDASAEDISASFLLFYGMVFLWAFAIGALCLVAFEIIVPTGSLPTLREVLFGWGPRLRRARRYFKILWIFSKHGLASQVRGFRSPEDEGDGGSRVARSLRLALDEAGITFIKAGQMMSTRADLLSPPFIEELSKLQTTAEPEPWQQVALSLTHYLGKPLDEVFHRISDRPLASASGAQAHRATLKDGRDVVVKVQRPGASKKAAVDLDILQRIARMLERNAPWARKMRIASLTEGFAESIKYELDYREEVDNMGALRASLNKRGVRIPWVAKELCSSKVVVMEYFDGRPVGAAADWIAALPQQTRRASAQNLLEAVLHQIVKEGLFHADLHPGNVFIWPDGSMGLLDFGSVGRIDAVSRRYLGTLLWAIDSDDPVLATDSLLNLVDAPPRLDERQLTREVGLLITKFRGGFSEGSGSLEVFSSLLQMIVSHGLAISPSLSAAMRSLGALEGTLKLIDPDLDLVESARKAGRDAIGPITPSTMKEFAIGKAMHLAPLIEHLPHRINKITEDLESGNFRMNARIIEHPQDRAFLTSLVQQLVGAILAAAAVLGGILLITTPGGPKLLPEVSVFTMIGGLLTFAGFMLALRSVALMFGKRKNE